VEQIVKTTSPISWGKREKQKKKKNRRKTALLNNSENPYFEFSAIEM